MRGGTDNPGGSAPSLQIDAWPDHSTQSERIGVIRILRGLSEADVYLGRNEALLRIKLRRARWLFEGDHYEAGRAGFRIRCGDLRALAFVF